MPRLKRSDCSRPGIARVRRGKGFEYRTVDGEVIQDEQTLERIRALAIPPAWKDVWICPYANGHLQATGTDAAGRRQYLYHPKWREDRDREKFTHMIEFAAALPVIRQACHERLQEPEMTKEKVLACAVRLLDRGFFRIGTEGYTEQNQSYGLATIRKEHVKLGDGGVIMFDYRAKSGQQRIQSVVDADVFEVVAALKKRRSGGPELLAYKSSGRWQDLKSADINMFIKQIGGKEFTAKDFRTWSATVLAAVALAVSESTAKSPTARKRAMSYAVKEVAHYLGNTPAVCRASYIDPRVFDRFLAGSTIADSLHALGDVQTDEPSTQGAIERAVLKLLGADTSQVKAA